MYEPRSFLSSSRPFPPPLSLANPVPYLTAAGGPDVRHMEAKLPRYYGADAVEIPGARSLLDAVVARNVPWAIVTSGTVPLVTGWLDVLGLVRPSSPDRLVTAESVDVGKPDPACYLLGRQRLGLATPGTEAAVLVVEDSPAGILAGKAAGCKVLGLVTSHTAEQVAAAGPDWIVKDLASVVVVDGEAGSITLEIRDGLVAVP